MAKPAPTPFVRTVAVHARRDIRRAIHHLRHNGALLTFILLVAMGMWFAGSYMQRHPLMTATMDDRAGCDVGSKLHQTARGVCAPSH